MTKLNYNFYDSDDVTVDISGNKEVVDVSDEDKTMFLVHAEHVKIVISKKIADKFKDIEKIFLAAKTPTKRIMVPQKGQTKTVLTDGSIVYEV